MTHDDVVHLVFVELGKAEHKFPGWPSDAVHGAAIVAEEAGELVRAALDWNYGREQSEEQMIKEASHTAATALRFLFSRCVGEYNDDTVHRPSASSAKSVAKDSE